MKYLTFAILLFVVIQYASAVHQCYVCDGKCENLSKDNIQTCQNLTHAANHFLCESKEYRTDGRTVKKCVINHKGAIKHCDELNLTKNSSCYHCDRELCNLAASMFSAKSIVVTFVTLYALTKFV